MSYCRFSSDNGNCDIHACEAIGDYWEIIVALNYGLPDFREIKLPSAGKAFKEKSLQAFRDRLLLLREEGLRFPDFVLEQIDLEMKGKNNDE